MENSGEFDLSSAIEQIQSMMNTDDGQAKLNNIINAFMGPDDNTADSAPENHNSSGSRQNNSGFGNFGDINQMDMMIKLGNIMSTVKSQQTGKNAALLYAIKPYLKKSRQDKTDGAIKIMGMVKAFSLLKDSGINLDI